jgi:hypothetical protein
MINYGKQPSSNHWKRYNRVEASQKDLIFQRMVII